MILRGSRYEGVPLTGIKTVDGKTKKFLHDRKIFSLADVGENAFEHTVEGDQTIDTLADIFYNDDRLWWLIADVNDILFAFDVKAGDVLVIPDPSIIADLRLL